MQEKSGCYKPLSKPFRTKDGLSTVPVLMEGHPDDVPGGKLISTEVRTPRACHPTVARRPPVPSVCRP